MTVWPAAIIVLLLVCACTPAQTSFPTRGAGGEISILDVIDGDTIKISETTTGMVINARLVGYDTPETFEPGCAAEKTLGQSATRRLQMILRDGKIIETNALGTDRYGRRLLQVRVDGADLADIMVTEGLAVRYSGGQRVNWCQKLGAV